MQTGIRSELSSARLGNTGASLTSALDQEATELSQIGTTTNDISRLLGSELLQAAGGLTPSYIDSATDLGSSTSSLSLTRSYDGSLLGRDNVGAFGAGWTFTYDITAYTNANGDVFIKSPAGLSVYTRQSDGSFISQVGDTSNLSLVDGAYQLRQVDGSTATFGADGKLDQTSAADGSTTTLTRDGAGRVIQVSDGKGESLAFHDDANGRIITATDQAGHQTSYSYDASGTHLLEAAGPGGTTSYAYSADDGSAQANALTTIISADGTHTSLTYDAQGRVSSQSGDGGAGRVTYSYDDAGQVNATDALGNTTKLLYDTDGNLSQAQDALGRAVQLRYDDAGNLSQVIGSDNSTYGFTYDWLGNPTSYTDPLGGKVAATYKSGTGLLTSFSDQLHDTMQYTYDTAGDLTGIGYTDGSGTQYQDRLERKPRQQHERARADDRLSVPTQNAS